MTKICNLMIASCLLAALATAQSTAPSAAGRQSLEDAWWTGPLLAPSAATLPRGHFLIEPYVYDVTSQGFYNTSGTRVSAPHANGFGSLTYINYGLLNRFTVGIIPTFSYNEISAGPSSDGVGIGDLTAQAQFRLSQFQEGHWMPTVSVNVQQTFPTGKYDRLSRASDGFGAGAYTTTLGVFSQTYFWLPNRRILRARLNFQQSFSGSASVNDASVYGTSPGFSGHANPGSTLFIDLAGEYSITRSWVLALDATYRHQGNTAVSGFNADSQSLRLDSGFSEAYGFAPALEYNWKRNWGVIAGTRFIGPGRNTTHSISPVVAVNWVH